MAGDRSELDLTAIILAGGFQSETPAHARTIPIALRTIAGSRLIDLLVDKLSEIARLRTVFVLVNEVNRRAFEEWRTSLDGEGEYRRRQVDIEIQSNGIPAAHKSRGAAGDLAYAVREIGLQKQNVLVLGGDNFFDASLKGFVERFRSRSDPYIAVHQMEVAPYSRSFGVVELDPQDRVISFEEKPETARSRLVSTLCYLLPPATLRSLDPFVTAHDSQARPGLGAFMEHIVLTDGPVFGYQFAGQWYDVGSTRHFRALNQRELLRRFETSKNLLQPIEAVILFADIIGSVSVAEFLDDKQYDAFLTEYQQIALDVIGKNLAAYSEDDRRFVEYVVRGDEAQLILYTSDPERDAKTALSVAIELKRGWLLSRFNKSRKGHAFYDVGVGIHYGTVMLGHHPSIGATERTFNAEGYAISLAKRIEGFARNGRLSRIMLSKAFRRLAALDETNVPLKVAEPVEARLAGIYGVAAIEELEVHGDIEDPEKVPVAEPEEVEYYKAVLENSQHDLWLLLMIARYFYDQEDYASAQYYYRDAITRFPEFAAGYTFLGRSLYRQGRFAEAKRHLLAAYERNPTSPRINSFLAVTLRHEQEYADAIRHHEEAITSPVATAFDYNAYAYTLADMADMKKLGPDAFNKTIASAREQLEKARAYAGADCERLSYIFDHTEGMVHFRGADYEKADSRFRLVITRIDDDNDMHPRKREEKRGEAAFHLGKTLYKIGVGQWKEARRWLDESLRWADGGGFQRPYWFEEATNLRNECLVGR